MSQYKAYPAYKDSGVEWIGQVPEHWEVKPICRVTSVNDDALSDSTTGSTRISYVDISSVGYTEGIKQATEMAFEDAPSRARRKASTGDVVVSTVRTYLKAVAAVTDEYADCIFSTGFAVLRARQLEQSFLKWMILNELLIQSIEAHSEGLSYPAINASALVKLKSVIPPPEEQASIAATLDRETARIDALIQKKTRFIELLKEKRQALITHAVTKGLDPNVKMKDSGVEWIGQVPEEWLNRKVFHAFQTIGSGTTPPSKEHEWYQGGTIPWITTSELRENTVVETKKCVTPDAMQKFSALKIFPAGSLAIAMYGATIGRLGFLGVPSTTNQACCVLSGERDLNVQFLYYWLMAFRAEIVALFSEGGGQPNINQEVIASLWVPSPDPEEQATIAATLDRETARIDTLIGKAEQSITLLKERRAAFITAAVTGQIDLRGEQ